MSDIRTLERYLHAATRDNTRKAYRAALEHFEVSWGGFLPASSDSVARYLVEQAGRLSTNTLKLRLAALAQWHTSQGFPDPTKAPLVRQVFRGIRALHPAQEKQAEPLQLQQLEHCVVWLEREGQRARAAADYGRLLRCWRDRALILLGFWRALRSDELCRLQVEHIQARAGEGMTFFLPQSKGDRDNLGTNYSAPALQRLCPVQAYLEWVAVAGIARGPVFRGINRWGQLQDTVPQQRNSAAAADAATRGAGRRAVQQPLAAPRLCHLGDAQRLGPEVLDELCRLEGRQVGLALCRGRGVLRGVSSGDGCAGYSEKRSAILATPSTFTPSEDAQRAIVGVGPGRSPARRSARCRAVGPRSVGPVHEWHAVYG